MSTWTILFSTPEELLRWLEKRKRLEKERCFKQKWRLTDANGWVLSQAKRFGLAHFQIHIVGAATFKASPAYVRQTAQTWNEFPPSPTKTQLWLKVWVKSRQAATGTSSYHWSIYSRNFSPPQHGLTHSSNCFQHGNLTAILEGFWILMSQVEWNSFVTKGRQTICSERCFIPHCIRSHYHKMLLLQLLSYHRRFQIFFHIVWESFNILGGRSTSGSGSSRCESNKNAT